MSELSRRALLSHMTTAAAFGSVLTGAVIGAITMPGSAEAQVRSQIASPSIASPTISPAAKGQIQSRLGPQYEDGKKPFYEMRPFKEGPWAEIKPLTPDLRQDRILGGNALQSFQKFNRTPGR